MLNSEAKYEIQLDENSIHNLSVNIFLTNNWLLAKYKAILNKYKLKYNQYHILKILAKSSPKSIPMYLIQQSIIDKNVNLSRVIDSLFIMDLVNRVQSGTDRRVVDVSITKKGIKLLAEIEIMFKKFESLPNENNEVSTLNTMLNNFREAKEKYFHVNY